MTDSFNKSFRFYGSRSTKGCSALTKASVRCHVPDLAAGESATVEVAVRATRRGTFTNTAAVSADRPADPNSGNNSASQTTTVNP